MFYVMLIQNTKENKIVHLTMLNFAILIFFSSKKCDCFTPLYLFFILLFAPLKGQLSPVYCIQCNYMFLQVLSVNITLWYIGPFRTGLLQVYMQSGNLYSLVIDFMMLVYWKRINTCFYVSFIIVFKESIKPFEL